MYSMLQSLECIRWIIIVCYIAGQGQVVEADHYDELAVSSCQIYGRLHFKVSHERLDQPQSLWWCKKSGDYVVYENEWVQILITVTDIPSWNRKYQIIFKHHNTVLCTIDSSHNICNHETVETKTWSLITQIVYPMAFLRIIIIRYGNEPYYDIILHQRNTTIFHQSKGLCIHGLTHCEIDPLTVKSIHHRNQLEVINPTDEQLTVHEKAEEICVHYHNSVHRMMRELDLSFISQTAKEKLIISCINDLESTGNKQFAKSVLQLFLFETVNDFNMNRDQTNNDLEKINYILVKTLRTVDDLDFENFPVDGSQSDTLLDIDISEKTSNATRLKSKTNNTFISVPTFKNDGNYTDICHVYGDPHVISFAQQSNATRNQYWCKISGEHSVIKNDYVEMIAFVQEQTWLINKFIIRLLQDNGSIICTVTDHEQYCNNPKIRITRPSLTQMDILYTTPRLYISIVSHQYDIQWYDISVRMAHALIHRSSGLCILPSVMNCDIENSIEQENIDNSLSKLICEQYLMAAIDASISLDLADDPERHKNALIACIHDYQTTNNKYSGASIVDMIIKNGINQQQLDDMEFELKTVNSINVIDNALIYASIQIDSITNSTIQISNTTLISTTSLTTSTTSLQQTTSLTTSTTSLQQTTITTISSSSTTIKSAYAVLICILLSFFIELPVLFLNLKYI
ncbi:unnamed protein product [Rotaria magnacalcarata]|uniref:Uncharacterized protein n=1 Tax=Rotaria magnacalcarata TaxID=392030 RepID=A0A816YQK3_9BILA|nr:unnamed protein product [Rotaria magnacalcarata]